MFEILPIRSTLYTPENKVSAWVSKKEDNVARDKSKEYQGVWAVEGFTLDNEQESTEIWIFRDNDVRGIDRRVLENNSLQGAWGYAPKVDPRKAEPKDIWFFPPKSAKCKIPPNMQEYNHRGTWVKPIFKRNFSELDHNTSGFISDRNKAIAKGGKLSVAGKWRVMGFNDDVVRGKKNIKEDDDDPSKARWEIFVRKPCGSQFPISVIPGNKITEFKTKVLAEEGIPIEEQRLIFNDVPLKDKKTLVGSGIRNGDTIDLGRMKVRVRTRNGKIFTFEVDPDETVENLKKMAEKRQGVPPLNEQRLYFKGKKLKDGKSLSHFNIRHKSTIDLGAMIIYVQPLGDEPKVQLDVEPTDTLKSIKVKVKNRLQMQVADQRLAFQEKEMLNDLRNLEHYQIKHLDTIFMIKGKAAEKSGDPKDPGMIIHIIKKWNDQKFKLQVKPTNTIIEVKKMIEASEKIPVEEQRLTFKEKSIYNPKTLEQCKIKNKAILHLGQPKNLDTESSDVNHPDIAELELPDLKKNDVPATPYLTFSNIKQDVEQTNNIPKWKEQTLFFDDEVNARSLTNDPGTNEQDPLLSKLQKDPVGIEVKTPDGRSFEFDFDPINDTVKDLKQNVAKTISLPVKDLHLIDNDDVMLGDEDKIPSNRAVLEVAPLIEVAMPDKTKVNVPLLPTMNFDDVKDFVEEKTGIPKANQWIFFFDGEGNELDDRIPMGKAGIKAGSGLKMCLPPPEENRVTVRSPDGRSFEFDFDPINDTVKDLKMKNGSQLGVPIKDFPSLLIDNVEVDDEYQPSRGTIDDFEPIDIIVELSNHQRITVAIVPMQTIGELKDIIEKRTGVKKSDQRIFFFDTDTEEIDDCMTLGAAKVTTRTPLKIISPGESKKPKEIKIKDPSGRTFQLFVDPDEPAKEVKDRIAQKLGFPIGGFTLDNKKWNDIDDEITLEEAGFAVRNGGFLEIDPPEIEIELPTSKKMKLKLLPTMTIRDVQEIVKEEAPDLSTSEVKQRLFFLDGIEELDDDTPFEKLRFGHRYKIEMQSMTINIHHWNGDCFKIDVQSDWYIDDIRDCIHRLTDIPLEQQNISFIGEPVKEDLQLTEQGIVKDSTLTLEPMSVRVKIPHRKKPVRFVVKPTDTIDTIKRRALEKVKKEKDGSICNYYLLIGGQELDDKEIMGKYDIQHDDLLTFEEFKLRVMHWSGEIIDLDDMKRNDTIASLKKRILKTKGIPIDDQRLSLNGKRLKDMNTFEKEEVKHRATLILEPLDYKTELPIAEKKTLKEKKTKAQKTKKFKAIGDCDEIMPVIPDWKRRIFFFDCDDTFDAHIELEIMHWTGELFKLDNILLKTKVSEIKNKIFKLKGIKEKKQKIKLDGKILDDKNTLLEESVGHRSILVLESPMKNPITNPSVERISGRKIFKTVPTKLLTSNINITVKHWNGDTFNIGLAPNYYIDDVKDLIYDMKKIPLEEIRLLFQGQPTHDEINLKEQDIVDGSVLVLEPMRVVLELPNKKEPVFINVEVDQKLSSVKKKIANMSNAPLPSICIMFGGEELDYSKTIFDSEIEHEDTLKVETYEVKIMHWSGEVFSVYKLSPNSTPHDVKERIFQMQSIRREEQNLSLKGQVLNDILRLKDQGVQHKSIVVLQPPEEKILSPVKEKVLFSFFTKSATDADMSTNEESDKTKSSVSSTSLNSKTSKLSKKTKAKSLKTKKEKSDKTIPSMQMTGSLYSETPKLSKKTKTRSPKRKKEKFDEPTLPMPMMESLYSETSKLSKKTKAKSPKRKKEKSEGPRLTMPMTERLYSETSKLSKKTKSKSPKRKKERFDEPTLPMSMMESLFSETSELSKKTKSKSPKKKERKV